MPLLAERRRHPRTAISCPTVIRDTSGRVLQRGRAVDISPCGIRVVGPSGPAIHDGQQVWVEMSVPRLCPTGPKMRIVKLRGEVRRVQIMGAWRSVVVVLFETDFSVHLLGPVL
jgi:hypothetical protein